MDSSLFEEIMKSRNEKKVVSRCKKMYAYKRCGSHNIGRVGVLALYL